MAKFTTPLEIPSQNKRDRTHWSKHQNEKRIFEGAVFAALNGKIAANYHGGKKKAVRITSHRKRLLDVPNLWGGAKGFIDALKKLELIRDDSPKWARFEISQELSNQVGTTVSIEDENEQS